MGFWHRVLQELRSTSQESSNAVAGEVFEVTGKNPLLEIALELERIALEDEYFVSRKLLSQCGFLFRHHLPGHAVSGGDVSRSVCHPRTSGWIAQWQEMLLDSEQKIARPRQIYEGYDKRDFVPMEKR
jgi:citrate synthase